MYHKCIRTNLKVEHTGNCAGRYSALIDSQGFRISLAMEFPMETPTAMENDSDTIRVLS